MPRLYRGFFVFRHLSLRFDMQNFAQLIYDLENTSKTKHHLLDKVQKLHLSVSKCFYNQKGTTIKKFYHACNINCLI